VRAIAHGEIIELLNKMAEGQVESTIESADESGRKVTVRGRVVSREEIWACLMRVTNNNTSEAKSRLKFFADKQILKLGLRLECSECFQRNWYPIEDISEEVRCERCLKVFRFPVAEPQMTAWCYRTQGAFSAGNYAQGNYSVALALKFLTGTIDVPVTWVPGIEITKRNDIAFEVDLAMWRNEHHLDRSAPYLVLAECKTYDEFTQRDLSRARELGKRFPGSVLAFVTLRTELGERERARLQRLSRRGRRYAGRGEEQLNPVLILTGHELMNDMGPPYCWAILGSRAEPVAQRYQGHRGIAELCDATQQLHLGMEPYHEWLEQHFKKRAEARARRGTRARDKT